MVREIARKYALQNAVLHGGVADAKAVIGKILAEQPALRSKARDIIADVEAIVREVNALDPETQRAELQAVAPELLERREVAETGLPPLPDAVEGKVVVRLAPYPSGPLHIGNARAFLLNDEYAKRYHGRLILAFDDTIGSEEKPILPEAYDQIREGLEWAGIDFHEIVYKSDRIPLHYEWAETLIGTGRAYVCECSAEKLQRLRREMKACEHRLQEADHTFAMWRAMLDGQYREGEAVLRLKTDLAHPNPAFRDRVLFRIAEREHPRVGTKYRVWPLLEFSWAVDDHLLKITHVIRGKDLVIEDMMEEAIWDILGVGDRPHFVPDPVNVEIEGLPPVGPLKVPLHPDFPGRGERVLPVASKVHVPREDFEKFRGKEVRLKDFCNVVLDHRAKFLSMENRDIPKIQWVAHGGNGHVVMPDGSESRGLAEPAVAGLKA